MELVLTLEKARRKAAPSAGQGAFSFDEESHPRAQSGAHDGKYKPGEFVPKGAVGGAAPKVSSAVVGSFHNAEDGVTAHVAKYHRGGFSVAIQDSDSGEYLPSAAIYPTQEKAEAAARKAAGLPGEQPKEEPAKPYRSPYRRGSLEHTIDRAKQRQADHPVYIYPTREGYRSADTVPPGVSQYVAVHPGGEVETIKPDFGEAPTIEQLRQLGEDTGGAHDEPEEEPEEAPETPAWQMSEDAYLARENVNRPMLGEVSGLQLTRMTGPAKKAYHARREVQRAQAAAASEDWRQDVFSAYDRGEFGMDTHGLAPGAKAALFSELRRRHADASAAALEEARQKKNSVTSVDQVKEGDRLFDRMSRSYGTVLKKDRARVVFESENRSVGTLKIPARQLDWRSFDDLKADTTVKALLVEVVPPPTLLLKGRRKVEANPHQLGFNFDAHPRAGAGGSGEYKGGEFIPRVKAGLKAEEPKPEQGHAKAGVAETASGSGATKPPDYGPIRDEDYKGPRYTYGLSYRPAGYSHMPDGWIVGSEREHPAFPSFGVVDYPRPLTDEELQSYQLDKVHEQVPGGLSQKDMMVTDAVIREWQQTWAEWSPTEQAQITALIDAWDAGPRPLAEFLRDTQETNDFSYTLLSHVKLPAVVAKALVITLTPHGLAEKAPPKLTLKKNTAPVD